MFMDYYCILRKGVQAAPSSSVYADLLSFSMRTRFHDLGQFPVLIRSADASGQ